MKYLYKILRLFFCGHKYDLIISGTVFQREDYDIGSGFPIGIYYDKNCRYCGKVKRFESTT